jgi:hypothetical protein
MVMQNARFVAPRNVPHWRELYMTALHREQLGFRIDEAERAIILRRRELLATPDDTSEEVPALDKARHALGALRTCLVLKTREFKIA